MTEKLTDEEIWERFRIAQAELDKLIKEVKENEERERKMSEEIKPSGLALLRKPFADNQISKLPKPTKAQTEEVKNDFQKGIRCTECGGWHHPKVVHLDYVGHAALTDRLLDADLSWNWEPMSLNQDGGPKFDSNNGLWIKLTVCGVTRLGYGHPDGKTGGDSFKETIGDALRNAAMRFGAALDLWHKGDLHLTDDDEKKPKNDDKKPASKPENKAPQGKPLGKKTLKDVFEQASLMILANPAELVIDFGTKFKGKKMSDLSYSDIEQNIEYWEKQDLSTIPNNISKFLVNANQYLILRGHYPPERV